MNRRTFASGLASTLGFAALGLANGAHADDPPVLSTDDVASAIAAALSADDVPTDGDGDVSVTGESGYFKYAVRLAGNFKPAGKVPDDPDPGTVTAANYLLLGSVTSIEDQTRVTARIVNVETSQIIEATKADAAGATKDAITDAAQIAFGDLSSLKS